MNNKLKILDAYIFQKMTFIRDNDSRRTFQCNIDTEKNCDFKVYSNSKLEIGRMIKHLMTKHTEQFNNKITEFFESKQIHNFTDISVYVDLIDYIKRVILPKLQAMNRYTSFNRKTTADPNTNQNHLLNLNEIDLARINQIILEHGVYENQPQSVITSKEHAKLFIEFLKLGFEMGRSGRYSSDQFITFTKTIHVPRNLLKNVGGDYFSAFIQQFQGKFASFLIDAGKINQHSMLVFVLYRQHITPIIYDFIYDFDSSYENYREAAHDIILKAKKDNITITGIVTDNLPVQLMALSQENEASFQNIYEDAEATIHLRCCNHLLNLSFKDWMKQDNSLTIFEEKSRLITNLFRKKEYAKFLVHKIPTTCPTRWSSHFQILEYLIKNFRELLKIFLHPHSNQISQLKKIMPEFLYFIDIGFPKVYPLLVPFYGLTSHLQNSAYTSVHTVLIIEFYLNQMKANIEKYEIPNDGYQLIECIEKRLLLHKNNQIYQLASLFTLDGIIRYRKIVGDEFDIPENDDYWHIPIKYCNINFYIGTENIAHLELNRFKDIIDNFEIENPKIRMPGHRSKKNIKKKK